MASSKQYLEYILDQLSPLDGVACRAMMGEYILYYQGKLAGGVYDDRLLVKPTASAQRLLPDAPREKPYEGAKEMLLVENTDDRAFLCSLLEAMEPELSAPKKRSKGKEG